MEDHELLINFGGELKKLDNGKFGGYLVVFGDPKNTDLTRDFFTDTTDFGFFKTVPVHFDHGFDPQIGRKQIGVGDLKFDEVGAWVEMQLEIRDEYEKMIAQLADEGLYGLSSGATAHFVQRKQIGKSWHITNWPIVEASITPTPAEPRTKVMSLKSYGAQRKPKEPDIQALLKQSTDDLKTFIANLSPRKKMEDEIKGLDQLKTSLLADVDSRIAEAAKASEEAATKAAKEAFKKLLEDTKGDVSIHTRPTEDSEVKIYERWLRTGDPGAAREMKASNAVDMQEGTAGEGGVLVPTDHANTIIARRDEASIPRRAGARIITTIRDQIEVPIDNEDDGEFVITAEEAAYDTDTPALDSVVIVSYKFTKLMKISEELLEDETSNLLDFISNFVGRGMAKTENQYTTVGTGTGQPEGIFVGGTAAITAASATAIAPGEIYDLYYSLAAEYRDEAVWAMHGDTEGHIRQKQGEVFLFQSTPAASNGQSSMDTLLNKRVFNSAKIATIATAAKTLAFANWGFYGLVDRRRLAVKRLDELFAANGQVGFLYSFRLGGAVLQAEAIQYMTQT